MNDDPGIIDPDRWSRPLQVAALVGVVVAFGVVVEVSLATAAPDGSVAIWLGNGLLLGAALLVSRRWWPVVLGTCAGATVVLLLHAGVPPALAIGAAAANLVVVLTAAHPIARDRSWVQGRSNTLDGWVAFALWGVVVAPFLGAVIGVAVTVLAGDLAFTSEVAWSVGSTWFLADALGMCVVVPVLLRLRRPALVEAWHRHRPVEAAVLGAVLLAVSGLVFASSSVGAVYLVVAVLIVVLFRYSFVGLTVSVVVVATAVLGFTARDEGPFARIAASGDALVAAQVFLLVLFATLVLVATLDEQNRHHALSEEMNEEVYELLATASGATIFVADADGRLRYVSSSIAGLLGIFGPQLLGYAWVDHVHPDDAPALVRDRRPSGGGGAHVVRMRHYDGSWRWVELSVHRSEHRDRSGADVRVGMLRDVDARVRHELDLRNANERLAHEATTDPLTGLANRRRFTEASELAWSHAIAARRPISLLVIDVDLFKAFNDRYGHPRGDDCLQQLAEILTTAVRHPADLVARYGGEEFVILLPGTDKTDALGVAKRVRGSVRAHEIEHPDSPHGVVTVSVGVGTVVPRRGDRFERLVDAADAAMYRSKDHGRDRIEIGDLLAGAR